MTLRKEPSTIRNRKFDQAMLAASDAMMAGALAIRTPEEASRFIAKAELWRRSGHKIFNQKTGHNIGKPSRRPLLVDQVRGISTVTLS